MAGSCNPSDHQQMIEDEPTDASRFDEHDIFLSHSGKQKGFVKDLYKVLYSKGYSAFLDITHHSLPPCKKFPTVIIEAAANCKLALVVLSDDFICSKWPMIELCTFVDSQGSSAQKQWIIKILPIFYKLAPADLKLQQNRQKWRTAWEAFAKGDPTRINVTKWENALDTLGKLSGIVFDPSKSDGGELSYIQKILSSISEIVKPLIKYDMMHVRGRQRLCKVICGEFSKLECRIPQPSHLASTPKVCILGMYGIPGSGKSTLSKCLCNHYARQFNGRTFCLELPANPTKGQLVEISKNLLKQVTNFSDMVDLDIATDLNQVYSLLRRYLPSSSVFLVVDNIMPHDLAIEFVQCILMCDFQDGSKVLLVGRVFHVLQRVSNHGEVQKKCREEKCKYAYDSVRVPGIKKEEAVQILLQSAKGGWLPESCAPEDELDPKGREIVETVIRMSGFGENDNPEYLPMVVKIMGAELRDYNVEEWGNDMVAFWRKVQLSKVGLYKEEAVMKLLKDIFEKLPQHLQILFLDVALFILPQSYDKDQSARILSIMHKCDLERIQMDMTKLQRHCFLESVVGESIIVHDVFLEFAATCPESCMYYSLSHKHGGLSLANEVPPPLEQEVRTVVLELNEEYERFDFWEGFSSVKALVLRNCQSLRVLGLPVGLKSLPILEIDKCPQLTIVEVEEEKSISNSVRSFTCRNNVGSGSLMVMQHSNILGHSQRPALMEVGSFALKMRWLQDLTLANTGIKRLEDMSKCWPLLRQIEIQECWLEYFKVGNLPNLELFRFGNGMLNRHREYTQYNISDDGRCRSRFAGKDLLVGCPKLKSICIAGACIEDGLGMVISSMLQTLELDSLWHAESFPDLAKATQTLTKICAWECRELKHVSFMHPFEVLEEVLLESCPSLIQVDGLDHLVSLRSLKIRRCEKLQRVSGLSGLRRLEYFQVIGCESLERLKGVRDLVRLEHFEVGEGCSRLGKTLLATDLQNLSHLRVLHYYQHVFVPGVVLQLSNFVQLSDLRVYSFNNDAMNSAGMTLISLVGNLPYKKEVINSCEEIREVASGRAHLLGSSVFHLVNPLSIERLVIQDVRNLANLNGIAFLAGSLKYLTLAYLPNLTSLTGFETLVRLQSLSIDTCESIEELPSLSLMTDLQDLALLKCSKLKSLDGCKAEIVSLIDCKEMRHFPLSLNDTRLRHLSIHGSKFASIDALVQWVVTPANDENSLILCRASLDALTWEFCHNYNEAEAQMKLGKRLLETVGVELINRLISNDDDCFDFFTAWILQAPLYVKWIIDDVRFESVRRLLGEVSSKSKRWLKEQCQSNTLFQEHVISSLAAVPPYLLDSYLVLPWKLSFLAN